MRNTHIQSIIESIHHVKREACCSVSNTPHSSITPAEWTILSIIKENPSISTKTLSLKLGVTKSAISQLLKELDHKKYIQRTTDPNDHRSYLICATEKASSLLSSLQENINLSLGEIFKTLSDTELKSLAELHKKITKKNNTKI